MISQKTLEAFWNRHPDAETALRQWFRTALAADWGSLREVRRIYPHADGIRNQAKRNPDGLQCHAEINTVWLREFDMTGN